MHWEFKWGLGPTEQHPNRLTDGDAGWADGMCRSCGTMPDLRHVRVHLCATDPCTVVRASWMYKYYGPPDHFQPSTWRPATATAVAAPAAAAPAMVGDPVPSAPASPAAVASALGSDPPAPGADAGEESWEAWWNEVLKPSGDPAPPSPALKVSEHPAGEPSASAPAPPSGATLRPLRAPAPAPPSGAPSALPSAAPSAAPPVASPEGKAPIGAGKAAARVPAVAAPAELDPAKASDALLALARAIRKPCEYIGHSTFILLALCKGCRPYIWEGESRVDIVETYVPWASDKCPRPCLVDGVCCCITRRGSGGTKSEWWPVSESHPLALCRHFVAAVQMACGVDGGSPASINGFYARLGLAVLGAVTDGDCGLDVRCCVDLPPPPDPPPPEDPPPLPPTFEYPPPSSPSPAESSWGCVSLSIGRRWTSQRSGTV